MSLGPLAMGYSLLERRIGQGLNAARKRVALSHPGGRGRGDAGGRAFIPPSGRDRSDASGR